jgi:hypothetical protein
VDVGRLEAQALGDLLGRQVPQFLDGIYCERCRQRGRHAHQALPEDGLEALETAEELDEVWQPGGIDRALQGEEQVGFRDQVRWSTSSRIPADHAEVDPVMSGS